MEVKIGVTQSPKEIELDLGDTADTDALTAQVQEALGTEGGMLWLTDRRGRKVGVPAAKVAYVEFDGASEGRRVGFGAGMH